MQRPFFNFQVFNAPLIQISQPYIQRTNEEIDFLRTEIYNICRNDYDCTKQAGFLVLSGDTGVGKTTLIAHLLRDPSNSQFFFQNCQLRQAIWFNCYQWRRYLQDTDEESFRNALTKGIAHIKDVEERPSTLFIFDDVYHLSLIEIISSEIVQGLLMPCIAITRTRECLSMQLSTKWYRFVTRWIELPRFTNRQLAVLFTRSKEMLPTLKQDLSLLRELVDQCDGIPRPVSELTPQRPTPIAKAPNTVVSAPAAVDIAEISGKFITRHNSEDHSKLSTFNEIINMNRKCKTTLGFLSELQSREKLENRPLTTAITADHNKKADEMKLLKVPQFLFGSNGSYYQRQAEEERLLQSIKRASLFSSAGHMDTVAVININGAGGIGKSMLVAHVLSDRRYQAVVLQRYCKIDGIMWLDCGDCSGGSNEDEHTAFIIKSLEDDIVALTTVRPATSYDVDDNELFMTSNKNRSRRLLVVLDHFSSDSNQETLMEHIRKTSGKNNCSCIVIIIAAGSPIQQNTSTPQSLTIDRMTDWQLVDMFETVYGLKDKLNARHQLLALANSKLCHGMPLIASLVAAQLNYHHLDEKVCKQLLLFGSGQTAKNKVSYQQSVISLNSLQSTATSPFSVQAVVAKLVEEAIKTLSSSNVITYYNTLLLFEPGESVSIENDVAFLWQTKEGKSDEVIELVCQKLEELSLITRFTLSDDNCRTFVQVHPLIFEAAYHYLTASSNSFTGTTTLSKVRLGILLRLLSAKGLTFVQFIDSALRQQRTFIIEKLLQLIHPHDIAQLSHTDTSLIFSPVETSNETRPESGDQEIASDDHGRTGLMLTAKYGHFDLMRHQLLSLKALQNRSILKQYIHAKDSNEGMTALMLAVRYGHFESVRLLLSFDYDSDYNRGFVEAMMSAQNKTGETALMIAVQLPLTNTNIEIVRFLASKCTSDDVLKIQNATAGDTVLNIAAGCNNLNALKIIGATVAFKKDIQALMTMQNLQGDTPLLTAVRLQKPPVSLDLVRWICECCPDVLRYQDYQARCTLHLVTNLPCAIYLYEKWPDALGLQDRTGRTPLMAAIQRNNDKTGIDLIRFYASNSRLDIFEMQMTNSGESALMLAVNGRQLGTVKLILEVVAQLSNRTLVSLVQQRDQDGKNVLERAVELYCDDNCTNTSCNRYQHETEMLIVKMLQETLTGRLRSAQEMERQNKLKTVIESKIEDRRNHHHGHLLFLGELLKVFDAPSQLERQGAVFELAHVAGGDNIPQPIKNDEDINNKELTPSVENGEKNSAEDEGSKSSTIMTISIEPGVSKTSVK